MFKRVKMMVSRMLGVFERDGRDDRIEAVRLDVLKKIML